MPSFGRALRAAITVAATGVVVAACGDGGATGRDAGFVARRDAGRDAGFDAGFDAGGDAGIDAGSDAGVFDDAVEISAGANHACARRASGEVVCWGAGGYGQLGGGEGVFVRHCYECTYLMGSSECFAAPGGAVPGLTDAVEISAGGDSTCARRASGEVVCWGLSDSGQLGDAAISHESCSVCLFEILSDCSRRPVAVSGLADAVEISVGPGRFGRAAYKFYGGHACARRASGDVVCWGANESGQLGTGTTIHSTCTDGTPFDCSLTPVVVSGLTDAVDVSAWGGHVCAVRASGAVVCWGRNDDGQLGDGLTSHTVCSSPWGSGFDCSPTPVAVTGLSDAVEISAGGLRTCARRASGQVVCWGGGSATPTVVPGLTDAVEISAGGSHVCARRASGAVVCWGTANNGQLGDGTMTDSVMPVAVVGLSDAVEISAGEQHTCARRASGELVCWGLSDFGQLGDGVDLWEHSECAGREGSGSRYSRCAVVPVTVVAPH